MIYTVTLNPSIDYVVHLDSFVDGITNRTTGEERCIFILHVPRRLCCKFIFRGRKISC